jgi:hypothetical protein
MHASSEAKLPKSFKAIGTTSLALDPSYRGSLPASWAVPRACGEDASARETRRAPEELLLPSARRRTSSEAELLLSRQELVRAEAALPSSSCELDRRYKRLLPSS